MNILQLIPKGKLWGGENTRRLFLALQDGILRARNDVARICVECFPQTSAQLLFDWERVCQVSSREEVLGTLAATGGNSKAFYLSLATRFDPLCQIAENSKDAFLAGEGIAGQMLGAQDIPPFTVIFIFSVPCKIPGCEELLQKLKPAHVLFLYRYAGSTSEFIAGISLAGDHV